VRPPAYLRHPSLRPLQIEPSFALARMTKPLLDQSVEPTSERRLPGQRAFMFLLGAAALILVAGLWLVRGTPVGAWPARAVSIVRSAGPLPFFATMALAPLPLFWFTVPAGAAFNGQLSLLGVIAAALAAITVNLGVNYLLASRFMRPPLERLVRRMGFAIPTVNHENAAISVLLVRLTPGPPLFIQCFILGLARVPFGTYMMVSWLCTVPWIVGGVLMGTGLLSGRFAILLSAFGIVVVACLTVRLLRRRIASASIQTGPVPFASPQSD
jgi:uncharacterized membrane protein YdjX (TVP38/TMEM64 family)